MYFFAYRQENLGPYCKLLGILKLENLVKLKIATFISQIRNKGNNIPHLFSELLLPQCPTYTLTEQDMQRKIVIIEYMLGQIMVNFLLNFLPLSSGSRYLCPKNYWLLILLERITNSICQVNNNGMTYPWDNLRARSTYIHSNQLESLSSFGFCVLTDNVSLLVITNMFIFFFCLNNVQYVIYGNSANKQWIELN